MTKPKGKKVEIIYTDNRVMRVWNMLDSGLIPLLIGRDVWEVQSQSGGEKYKVVQDKSHVKGFDYLHEWSCNCYSFEHGFYPCKHILLVLLWKKVGGLLL